MSEDALWILACFALVFAINLMPAFMPSSWMVMAFFYIQFDLPLLVLTIGGAIISGFGRFFLARGSTWVKRHFMRDKAADLDELGAFLEERRRWLAPTVAAYALTPLPTNNLFVAAGLAEVSLPWVLAGFWTARIVADTFFVWTTDRVFDGIGDVFEGAFGSWIAILFQLLSVTSIILLYKLPWAHWLRRFTRSRSTAETQRAQRA
jgi:hypothetical protein